MPQHEELESGAISPDSGAMELACKRFAPRGPFAARAGGVAIVYQELNLAPHLSVEDNIMLGCERHRLGLIDRAYIIHSGRVLTEGHPDAIVANEDVRRLYLGEDFRL